MVLFQSFEIRGMPFLPKGIRKRGWTVLLGLYGGNFIKGGRNETKIKVSASVKAPTMLKTKFKN